MLETNLYLPETPHDSACLFTAEIFVAHHYSKKNGRTIRFRGGKGRAGSALWHSTSTPFISKTNDQKRSENILVSSLWSRARDIHLNEPIRDQVWCMFTFFYPESEFYTKKGKPKLTTGDLSNLYQGPEDALQKAGILENDALIRCHDLSSKQPGDKCRLVVKIFPYELSPTFKLWGK